MIGRSTSSFSSLKNPPKTQKQEAHHARFHENDVLPVSFWENIGFRNVSEAKPL